MAAALLAASGAVAAPASSRPGPPPGPPRVGAGTCDPLDDGACLLPFPNDRFTVVADTPTGLRVELPAEGMPQNLFGTRVDPTDWNRNDGFSPGSMVLADVPGLDLQATPGDPGGDPHSDPRRDGPGTDQRAHFLRTGEVIDVYDGAPYWTQFCRGPTNPNCP